MLNLISYWGVVTLITFVITSLFVPFILIAGNHMAKSVSDGALSNHWLSDKFIRLIGLDKRTYFDIVSSDYGDIKRYYFDDDIAFPTSLFTAMTVIIGGIWFATNEADLVTMVHTLASAAAPEIAYGFILAGIYFGLIKILKLVYKLTAALSKLESKGDSDA
jgi:hypothetical protein